MHRIAITPITAVTCNSQFEVIENAAIHVEDARIVFVGPSSTRPPSKADEILGGDNLVALPGLVNTHTHAAMTLLRGYADDLALEVWLQQKIWPFEAHLSGTDVYHGTRLALVEMLRGGTTCCADMYHFYDDGVRAYLESGIRACPGGVLLGFLPQAKKRIANAIAFAREYAMAGEGRITPFLAPHSLYTCDHGHWRAMIEGARQLGVPLHTHAAETRREVADVVAQWGASPIQTLKNIGALEGPLLAAHCVHVDDADIDVMRGATACSEESSTQPSNTRLAQSTSVLRVAHSPASNLKLASGFAPVPQFLQSGVTTGLGTDGAASNNNLDMWQEMRLAALLHKATTGDATAVSAQQALLMATREGARCLNLESDIGTLEAGKKADIVLMDFDKSHLVPRHNVVSHLVYSARAADVDTVLVDGRVLLRGGVFTQLDAAEICAQAALYAHRLACIAT